LPTHGAHYIPLAPAPGEQPVQQSSFEQPVGAPPQAGMYNARGEPYLLPIETSDATRYAHDPRMQPPKPVARIRNVTPLPATGLLPR
jgi:hypothetical protein